MSSKGKGRTLELEQIRKAEEKAAADSAEVRKKSVLTIGIIVAVIVGIGAWIALAPPPPGIPYQSQGNLHIPTPETPHAAYNSTPPSSGPHIGSLARWGVATEEIPAEIYIHNLEDAGIILMYNCPDGCDDLAGDLEGVLDDRNESNLLMMPYSGPIVDPDGTSYRAAAVAWSRILFFDDVDAARDDIDSFIQIYHGIDNHANAAPVHSP